MTRVSIELFIKSLGENLALVKKHMPVDKYRNLLRAIMMVCNTQYQESVVMIEDKKEE